MARCHSRRIPTHSLYPVAYTCVHKESSSVDPSTSARGSGRLTQGAVRTTQIERDHSRAPRSCASHHSSASASSQSSAHTQLRSASTDRLAGNRHERAVKSAPRVLSFAANLRYGTNDVARIFADGCASGLPAVAARNDDRDRPATRILAWIQGDFPQAE